MAVRFEELKVLQLAETVADKVWKFVVSWDGFAKETVGKQLVRAIDSVGANIAEAYGRYHYGEKLQFLYYARGSLFETKYWLNRAYSRALIHSNQFQELADSLSDLVHQLNTFAKVTKSQRYKTYTSNKISEQKPSYQLEDSHLEQFLSNENFPLFSIEDVEFLITLPTTSIT
ncbi:MAG: four helix bundle protein [Ardenticatenaceae bacterium]|nr:four helix bundle protein [Ardenticatenaceae bacterium]